MRRTQAGFSLLEILVSIVILALGLLGLALLQSNALKFNHSAKLRSLAISQAYGIADRMRANPVGIQNGHYNNLVGIPGDPACVTCSPADRATKDAFEWNTLNGLLLPSGQGQVTANGTQFIIRVHWDNDKSGVNGLGCSGNPAIDLTCITLTVEL